MPPRRAAFAGRRPGSRSIRATSPITNGPRRSIPVTIPARGPCEAKGALVHTEQVRLHAVHVSAIARCRALDVVMTISCGENFQKIRATAYAGFAAGGENCRFSFHAHAGPTGRLRQVRQDI